MIQDYVVKKSEEGTGIVQVPVPETPAALLAEHRRQASAWIGHFGRLASSADAALAAAVAEEAEELRQFITAFVLPRLEQVAPLPAEQQALQLSVMVPFDTEGGLRDFLLHFFQLAEDERGELVYRERDPFERDVYILYDLLKVKRTLEVVARLREALDGPAKAFPSACAPAEQRALLDELEAVLRLLFTQCLPPEHREELLQRLSHQMLGRRAVLERREAGLLYSYPHVLRKYDYRRFFFLIYFKQGLKARVGSEDRSFRFDFVRFQILKQEYLMHWLTATLKHSPHKYREYQRYMVRGRSLLEWIVDAPDREAEMLRELPTPQFNGLLSAINTTVAPEHQLAIVPESEKFSLYHELKEHLQQAVSYVRAPIEQLRRLVEQEAAPAPRPAPEARATVPEPAPPEPPLPKPVVARWEIHLLNREQAPLPFLSNTMTAYPTLLGAQKTQLGTAFSGLAAYISETLENSPEASTVRRRTPKHEWALPYLLREIRPAGTRTHLLVLGAEVRAKMRGMGYQAKEAYQFTPYLVYATDAPDGAWGAPVGERHAAGKTLQEFPCHEPAVAALALALVERIRGLASGGSPAA
ncbi:MAG: hypothetical protein HY423_02780 [Candidatus Lambdaproteobacteria bacterium]|nr:hypothetical protein [Candidatus Lambdaproteobacteria bacterium]